MKTVVVAAGVSCEYCEIHIDQNFPDFNDDEWPQKSLVFFESQATEIVDALQTHLPGGTFDAVLREMLQRTASLLIVPIGI